jgi:redox-sensing transcriptional repressor
LIDRCAWPSSRRESRRAPADYSGFQQAGFRIVALFDNDPDRVGRQSRGGVVIVTRRVSRHRARRRDRRGRRCGARSCGQAVVDLIVQSGLKAILNFRKAP